MNKQQILKLSSTPVVGSSYPMAPNRFVNREYLLISYETEPEAIRAVLPEPLEPDGNVVVFEVMKMPDSSGFGDYTEGGIVIPALFRGEKVNFPLIMILDNEPPISGGREIWGFPKKFGQPKLEIAHDTLTGTIDYAGVRVATGTMGYKYENQLYDLEAHKACDPETIRARIAKKQINLKLIPDVSGKGPALAQLTSFSMTDIVVKGAWVAPARLHLVPHVNAPLADLPVRKVIGGSHFIADMTLPYGQVEHDYLRD